MAGTFRYVNHELRHNFAYFDIETRQFGTLGDGTYDVQAKNVCVVLKGMGVAM